MLYPVGAVVALSSSPLVGIDIEGVVGACLHAGLTSDATIVIEVHDPVASGEECSGGANLRTGRVLAMIAPVDAELPCGIWEGPFLDVLDMGPVDSYRNVMLRLACHCASVASDTSLVVDYESVVHH